MNKYLIALDTTSAASKEIAEKEGFELIPLCVLINGVSYLDQFEISNEELYVRLKNGDIPTTSQPTTGYIMEKMEAWKKENYDFILVLTCSSDLSGTNHGFHLAAESLEMDNIYIVDTRSVGAPILDGARYAQRMAEEGQDLKDILLGLDKKYQNSFSFLYPETLTQLKKGGRLSPMAAGMASLLKIKPLLYLKEDGSCVEKFGIARTTGKIIQLVVDKFNELKIDSLTHKVYISHADNLEGAQKIEGVLKAVFNDIDTEIIELPSVLVCHGGLGCIAVQSTFKG